MGDCDCGLPVDLLGVINSGLYSVERTPFERFEGKVQKWYIID